MPATAVATASGAEDVVVLRDISWGTYCQLNDENFSPAIRMAYFEGSLEIMTISARHENWERKIDLLIHTLAGALGIDCEGFGSVTMRRKDLRSGLEPDACFYFGPLAAIMRGREALDLQTDLAPDVAVEIDISRRSFSKFPLYAALGIRELWLFSQDEIALYQLADGEYRSVQQSAFLAHMTSACLTQLLADCRLMPLPEWLARVRAAAEGLTPPESDGPPRPD